jgi:hypothetical protein
MTIILKENSIQMDIKELVISILSNCKTFLLDYPYQSIKEAIWEGQARELATVLDLCSNGYVSSCCKHDVYTKYISSSPNDDGMLEWLKEGGKLGSDVLVKYESFSVCYKCRKWCGLLEDHFFTFPHESDII